MGNKTGLIAVLFLGTSFLATTTPVVAQSQVLQNSQMQNWVWVNDTSWQRFVFSESFLLTDIGYDNRNSNPFTLSVYKNGSKLNDVSFAYNSTGQWSFTSLGSSALSIDAGDVVDIVGAGQNQYVGVQSDISSQIQGITSVGFWFNSSNFYQYSGAGTLQPFAFANIKVQKSPSSSVPEPLPTWLLAALLIVGSVNGYFSRFANTR